MALHTQPRATLLGKNPAPFFNIAPEVEQGGGIDILPQPIRRLVRRIKSPEQIADCFQSRRSPLGGDHQRHRRRQLMPVDFPKKHQRPVHRRKQPIRRHRRIGGSLGIRNRVQKSGSDFIRLPRRFTECRSLVFSAQIHRPLPHQFNPLDIHAIRANMRHATTPKLRHPVQHHRAIRIARTNKLAFLHAQIPQIRLGIDQIHLLQSKLFPNVEQRRSTSTKPMAVRAIYMQIRTRPLVQIRLQIARISHPGFLIRRRLIGRNLRFPQKADMPECPNLIIRDLPEFPRTIELRRTERQREIRPRIMTRHALRTRGKIP